MASDVIVTDQLPDEPHRTRVDAWSGDPAGPDAGLRQRHGQLRRSATSRRARRSSSSSSVLVGTIIALARASRTRRRSTSDTDDPNDGDNTSTFTVGGAPQADLSIRKIPPAESPVAGVHRRIRRRSRAGRSTSRSSTSDRLTATGITFTDTLPPGVTFERVYDEETDTDLTALLGCDTHRRCRRPGRP